MKFYSPLRYPGGKSKLLPLVKFMMDKAQRSCTTYIEPFAGGAGIALSLLMEEAVEKIVINDSDKAVYSVWRAIKNEPLRLIKLLFETPININEWQKQQYIYNNSYQYSVNLAFATLFLNRVNRSGIITGGPIGGLNQEGKWKLGARFNKEAIAERINDISKKRSAILVYNQDVIQLIDNYLPWFEGQAFIYFDPPYCNKSKRLYKNMLSPEDHANLAERITGKADCPWIITYDDVPEIRDLYCGLEIRRFDLNYSAASKVKASEIIIAGKLTAFPSGSDILAPLFNIRPL
ncbi:MAG: DNA adenine methylase [Deltaproteobacteria bacterium]|jgi:DNA adenine methylase|nr:DNA adenine methylase [Deltaproteobacteria bacterium]